MAPYDDYVIWAEKVGKDALTVTEPNDGGGWNRSRERVIPHDISCLGKMRGVITENICAMFFGNPGDAAVRAPYLLQLKTDIHEGAKTGMENAIVEYAVGAGIELNGVVVSSFEQLKSAYKKDGNEHPEKYYEACYYHFNAKKSKICLGVEQRVMGALGLKYLPDVEGLEPGRRIVFRKVKAVSYTGLCCGRGPDNTNEMCSSLVLNQAINNARELLWNQSMNSHGKKIVTGMPEHIKSECKGKKKNKYFDWMLRDHNKVRYKCV